jgi:hypothetical protein
MPWKYLSSSLNGWLRKFGTMTIAKFTIMNPATSGLLGIMLNAENVLTRR